MEEEEPTRCSVFSWPGPRPPGAAGRTALSLCSRCKNPTNILQLGDVTNKQFPFSTEFFKTIKIYLDMKVGNTCFSKYMSECRLCKRLQEVWGWVGCKEPG